MNLVLKMKDGPLGLAIIALIFLAGFEARAEKVHLQIASTSIITQSFSNWNAITPWERITNYAGPDTHLGTLEMILQFQALKQGGLDFDYSFTDLPNVGRAMLEVIEGHAALLNESVWETDLGSTNLLMTEPVTRNGDFEKGIYVLSTDQRTMQVSSLEELRNFVPVTTCTWLADLKTLQDMQMPQIQKAPRYENMISMLKAHHGDFTLMEFAPTEDMSQHIDDLTFVPVPNIKVAIHADRRWIVAKSSPQATEIYAALSKGLKIMHEDGRINRAFHECGLINPRVTNWKRLF